MSDPLALAGSQHVASRKTVMIADGLELTEDSDRVRGKSLPNAMSVDVEDYFQVSAFEKIISRSDWPSHESRLRRNMGRILDLFDEANTKATFFTLGWIAENFPDVIREIVARGHELASHGYDHTRVRDQSHEQFFADVSRTRNILQDISGVEVIGYRAPSFSIAEQAQWAHPILWECGYRYSSSIYPVAHDHYGLPQAPRAPFRVNDCPLLEIPPSTLRIAGRNFPSAGGGFFRLLPMAYSRLAIRRLNTKDQLPAVFYFHPWEIDPDQPRIQNIPAKTRFRHYVNLGKFEKRLTSILSQFRWGRMDEIFLGERQQAGL